MSNLPDYIASAKPVSLAARAPWYKTIAPTYAGIMLWFVFWQNLVKGRWHTRRRAQRRHRSSTARIAHRGFSLSIPFLSCARFARHENRLAALCRRHFHLWRDRRTDYARPADGFASIRLVGCQRLGHRHGFVSMFRNCLECERRGPMVWRHCVRIHHSSGVRRIEGYSIRCSRGHLVAAYPFSCLGDFAYQKPSAASATSILKLLLPPRSRILRPVMLPPRSDFSECWPPLACISSVSLQPPVLQGRTLLRALAAKATSTGAD